MNQTVFLFALYLAGLLFGLLFKRRLPLPFICLSGLLWGALFYAAAGVIVLSLGLPYTRIWMGVFWAALAAALLGLNLWRGTLRLNRAEALWLAGGALLFGAAALAAERWNYTIASGDSFEQLMIGRAIALDGFKGAAAALGDWGVLMLVIQSASMIIGVDYLSAVYPVFALTLLLLFGYLLYRAAARPGVGRGWSLLLAGAGGLALFSPNFMVFQAFYVHTNLAAGAYLFTALAAFWLAQRDENDAWLVFAALALTGFSLARTESPIFALVFLALALSECGMTYRKRLAVTLPYLGVMLLWYAALLAWVGSTSVILSPAKVAAILGLLAGFGAFVLASRWNWIERWLLPRLPGLLLAALALVVLATLALQPEHSAANLLALGQNMFITGRWAAGWVLALALLAFALFQPRLPAEQIFSFGIPAFLLVVLALGAARAPYHAGWEDSGNRMLVHLFPIVYFYLLVKLSPAYLKKAAAFEVWLAALTR